jgi:CheY-like chemotaxis protein
MNVLIVEDNPISAKVLEHTLDRHGYESYTAKDGDQALEYLNTHPEVELVITDISMPKVDGFELIRNIKERPDLTEIPILVCTSQRPANVNQRLPMNGWHYIFKPIRAESLMQKVKEVTAQNRAILQSPAQTMEQVGMDSQAFLEVLDEFLKIVKDKIAQLAARIKEGSVKLLDLQDLMEGAKLIRADRVLDLLEDLNRLGGGAKIETIQSLYSRLLRELKATEHYLTLYAA